MSKILPDSVMLMHFRWNSFIKKYKENRKVKKFYGDTTLQQPDCCSGSVFLIPALLQWMSCNGLILILLL